MHAFDVLGDPVRRRILELLADGELASGAITAVVQAEFGISQPAVSQHLKVLRDSGFATVRPEGTRRLYAVDAAPFRELDDWLDPLPPRSGTSASIRSRPSSPAASANAAWPAERHRQSEGDHPMIDIVRRDRRRPARGRQPAASRPARASRSSLRRTYDAPIDDVWDALTTPERIGRWFLPISGDYRLGGRYQFEGNAGGEILACERPNRLQRHLGLRRGDQRRGHLGGRGSTHAGRRRSDRLRARAHGHRPRGPLGSSTARAPSASAGTGACSG